MPEAAYLEPPENINPSIDPLMQMLNTLVPPESVVIHDIFHNKYTCPTSVSARRQIQVMREFDKVKDLDVGNVTLDNQNIVTAIMKLAVNEDVLEALSRCFSIAHPKVLEQTKKYADESEMEYEDTILAAVDLFALEEIITAIVPLFLRLARRTGQALKAITPV